MTTLSLTGNQNYAARMFRVQGLVELPGLDNLRGVSVDGFMALVSRDTPVGTLMVAFVAESQLSDEFLSAHNLYRHETKNQDPTQKGYIEDSRRIRAINFRGHMSSALVMDAADLGITDDQEGAVFDTLDGVEICRKYEVKRSSRINAQSRQIKKALMRVTDKMMPVHFDTLNYWRNKHLIPDDAFVTVSQKLHGSSCRISHTIVNRQLKWWERALRRLGVPVQETEYAHVYGSRKVIKDPDNPNLDSDSFYGTDIWVREGQKYSHLLPKNIVVYGELVGWIDEDSPIQANYTYSAQKGTTDLYVYRVAVVTADGGLYDLPWDGVKQFCAERGLNVVRELWSGRHSEFVPEDWLDKTFYLEYPNAVLLSKDSPCDEGICVRWDGITPVVLKCKSPLFLGHETNLADKGFLDTESDQSV